MIAALLESVAGHFVFAAVPVSVKSIGTGGNSSSVATITAVTAETIATAVNDTVLVIHANDAYPVTNMGTPTATGSPTMHAIATADAGSSGANPHAKAWWYVANTAGAQTVNVTETGSHDEDKLIMAIVLGGGLNKTTFLDGTPTTAFAAMSGINPPIVAPSTSPAQASSYLICIGQSGYPNNPTAWTPPAGMTKLAEKYQPAAGSAGLAVFVAGQQLTASGATGTKTFTPTVTAGGGQVYAGISFAALTS